jgi:periplasmic protein TonB
MFTGIDAVTVIPRRRWTAVASFSLQAALVAAALALPLLRSQPLPEPFFPHPIFMPTYQPEVHTTSADPRHQTGSFGLGGPARPLVVNRDNGVHFPGLKNDDSAVDAPPLFPPGDPTGAVGIGPRFSISPAHPTLAKPPIVSVMMQGNLIHRVDPVYPAIARTTGVQGTVLVRALISRDGRIEQAQVASGSPLLSPAALEAIRQWKYRPYVLNGSPIEVETEITVSFVLQR